MEALYLKEEFSVFAQWSASQYHDMSLYGKEDKLPKPPYSSSGQAYFLTGRTAQFFSSSLLPSPLALVHTTTIATAQEHRIPA
jgi:hypothetical protein